MMISHDKPTCRRMWLAVEISSNKYMFLIRNILTRLKINPFFANNIFKFLQYMARSAQVVASLLHAFCLGGEKVVRQQIFVISKEPTVILYF